MSDGTDWGAPPTTGDTGGGGGLEKYLGTQVLNSATGAVGELKVATIAGRTYYYIDTVEGSAGAGQRGGERIMPGAQLVTDSERHLTVNQTGGLAEDRAMRDDERARYLGGGGGGGGGGSAPAYSSTRQAAQEAMAFEREQTAASQRFQAEQDALNRQAQERLRAMQELNALIQQEMANRQSA